MIKNITISRVDNGFYLSYEMEPEPRKEVETPLETFLVGGGRGKVRYEVHLTGQMLADRVKELVTEKEGEYAI